MSNPLTIGDILASSSGKQLLGLGVGALALGILYKQGQKTSELESRIKMLEFKTYNLDCQMKEIQSFIQSKYQVPVTFTTPVSGVQMPGMQTTQFATMPGGMGMPNTGMNMGGATPGMNTNTTMGGMGMGMPGTNYAMNRNRL